MALKGYFDGSGKVGGRDASITLGGVSCSEATLVQFEAAWGEVLDSLGFRFWHTSQLHYWMTDAAFFSAALRLLDVIRKFGEAENDPLITYACTTILADYARAKAEIPSLEPAESLCVNGCIGHFVVPKQTDLPIIITFDRDEKFIDQIKPVWLERRERPEPDWSRQIANITDDDWRRVRPLQAADLLAWAASRYQNKKRQEGGRPHEREEAMALNISAFFFTRGVWSLYDYDAMIAAHQRRQQSE